MNLLKMSRVSVLMMLMCQSACGVPAFWAKAVYQVVHGEQEAAVREIVNNGQGNRLQVIDPDKIPDHVKRLFPIVERKKVEKGEIDVRELKQRVDACDVVSFDIFDTLLLRPYVRPTDLFAHLEQLEGIQGFAKARVEAEWLARRKSNKDDISLDEIYSEIDSKYKPLKDREKELERRVLTVNPEMKEVFDYARNQNRRIIITSDMYLPTDFLRRVLEEKGYKGFDKIYVSGELGKSKHAGSLFEHILNDQKIKDFSRVLHIGDDVYSDKNMAEKAGLTAVSCQKRIDKLLSENKRAKKFYDNYRDNLDVSIMLGMLAMMKPSGNYWQDFGYMYAGPTILGFMKWLDKQVQKDDCKEVLFVARDGYTLEKVFNVIKTNDARTHYVYTPRKLSKAISFKLDEEDDVGITLEYYRSKDEFLKENTPTVQDVKIGRDFIEEHRDIYTKLVERERQKYARYFDQLELKHKKLIFVDTISGRLTSQVAVELILQERDIKGCYWFIVKGSKAEKLRDSGYAWETFQPHGEVMFNNWDIMELIMTAPTPPIDTLDDDCKPIFRKNPTKDEFKRIEIYPDISNGAVKFAESYVNIFNKMDVFFSSEMLANWMNTFCDIPTEKDKHHFADIKYCGDPSHLNYEPLMKNWF